MIGLSYDIHRLRRGGPLYIGSEELKVGWGAVAHSDGDVLLHSLIDATLGALGYLGDIGTLFPDTSLKWRGARSTELLRIIREKFSVSYEKVLLSLTVPDILYDELSNRLGDIAKGLWGLLEYPNLTLVLARSLGFKELEPESLAIQAISLVELRTPGKKALNTEINTEILGVFSLSDLKLISEDLGVKAELSYHYYPYEDLNSSERYPFIKDSLESLVKGFKGRAVDLTLIAQTPKLSPHREKLIKELASLNPELRLSLKFRSNEKQGVVGRGEGFALFCVLY